MTQKTNMASDTPVSFDELGFVNEPVIGWATKLGIGSAGYIPCVEVFIEHEGKSFGLYLEVITGSRLTDFMKKTDWRMQAIF